jgi:hypothetical protein
LPNKKGGWKNLSESYLADVREKLESYKIELVIGLSFSVPFFLFILFAVFSGDFSVLDPSYWIGVIAYNIAIVIGLWLVLSNRTLQLTPLILLYAVGLSVLLLVVFNSIVFSGDITQGVIAGSKLLWEGKNPYIVEEVPHASPGSPSFRWTTYAYLPVDLITYTILLGGMHTISSFILGTNIPETLHDFVPGFTPMGIFLSNMLFLVISIFLIQKILEIEFKHALLLGFAFFTVLIWNNVCLAQTLFFAGWYFHTRGHSNMTVFFWTLSMLTKYFTGIFIVAYIIEYLRKSEFIDIIIKIVIPVVISITVSLPFGLIEVFKSTVLFYNTEERILDGSFGGSIVSELVLFLGLENIVWFFTFIGFFCILVIALRISDLHQRLIVTSLLALCVISGISAQFFPMILFIFIISKRLLLFEKDKQFADREIRNANESSSSS